MRRNLALVALLLAQPGVALAECIFFEHANFGGARLVISNQERIKMVRGESFACQASDGSACPTELYRPQWNDRISSYKVSRNCTLRMWEHVNAGGWMLTRVGDPPYIGDRRNDKVSEALCNC